MLCSLKKLRRLGRYIPTEDQHLTGFLALATTVVVADVRGVEADDGFALETAQDLGHLLVLLDAKSDAIALSLPVRWVHVEQRVSVVAADAFLP